VKKEILASLTLSRPWRQVVSTNSWCKDVLIERCPASSRSRTQKMNATFHKQMNRNDFSHLSRLSSGKIN